MKGHPPRRILDDLRRARVLVIHPRDEDGKVLIDQLRRLGCAITAVWPLPATLPEGIDTVFVSVEDTPTDQLARLLEGQNLAVIAVVTYESPTSLRAIHDLNAHGVMSKPLRSLGILTQFTLARYRQGYEARLAGKVTKLEETLKGRRLVDRAIRLLIDVQGMSEDAAYKLLRDQATAERTPLAAIAEDIIAAHDTMARLGLVRGTVPKTPNKSA
ncbi:ANTAR domain-containing protein [Paenirhodobacter sp. CAU 1674]|uniref:ANTAR domain-containing response regulator n=1 Tax=Paenirhodobacter sp. CAU 1674 TaxID=3032596 RepID=UPI0023DADDB6|nr:ANTAR domain-containing protein [Paenirhodobacter sp. CAU 1674]MDF2141791.1 ANTAR domain-containing protein [Paenirhodobacter sp. CAU 1674]